MKKLFLAIALILATSGVMAQVTFEESNLKEAIAKAKAEKKMVMVIGSATWCGPCKAMEKDLFILPEVSKYIGDNFIVKKYYLDKEDPDNIKAMDVNAYPTLIFIKADGTEAARMVGAAKTGADFVKRMQDALNPENSLALRTERFKTDPTYGMEYVTYLTSIYKTKEADEALKIVFDRQTIAENFSDKNFEFYHRHVRTLDHFVINYILENSKKVMKLAGEQKVKDFMCSKSNTKVNEVFYAKDKSIESIETGLKPLAANALLNTSYAQFANKSKALYLAKNYGEIYAMAETFIKTADSDSRMKISDVVRLLAKQDVKGNRETLIAFLEKCLANEKNPIYAEKYVHQIKTVKDPSYIDTNAAPRVMPMKKS